MPQVKTTATKPISSGPIVVLLACAKCQAAGAVSLRDTDGAGKSSRQRELAGGDFVDLHEGIDSQSGIANRGIRRRGRMFGNDLKVRSRALDPIGVAIPPLALHGQGV